MKSPILAALVLGGTMSLAAGAANAATYAWTLTGPAASLGGFQEDGSGTFTTSVIGGKDTITSITGEIGGSAITGLTLTAIDGFLKPDNLFFSDTLLDTSGLGVMTAAGQEVIIESQYAPGSKNITPGNNYQEFLNPAAPGQQFLSAGVGTFSATAVPEPGAWALMIAGVFGIGAALRRRNRFAQPMGQTA